MLSRETYWAVRKLSKTKPPSRNIPTKTLKTNAGNMCIYLADCINSSILNDVFPDELKLGDVTSLCKKSNPEEKANYQPISVLPSLSKLSEKILYINK